MNDMKQPEALRLARELDGVYPVNIQDQETAAAELRRLQEQCDALLEAAKRLQARGWFDATSRADKETLKDMEAMRAAIAKATEATTPAQRLQEWGLLAPQPPKDEPAPVEIR